MTTYKPECEKGEFPCSDKCILFSQVCDRRRDCSDGSDEVECSGKRKHNLIRDVLNFKYHTQGNCSYVNVRR